MLDLFAAAANIWQTAFNAKQVRENQRIQNEKNMELSKYEFDRNLEAWNKGNEYNSPTAQMARLKQAGLNPNLVYGSGQVTGNAAGQLPKYSAPQYQRNHIPPVDLPAAISMFQDIQIKQAQVDNLKAQRDTKAQAMYWANFISQSKEVQERIKANMMSNNFGDQLGGLPTPWQSYSLESMKGKNNAIQTQINKMIADTEYKRLQTSWYTENVIANLVGKGVGTLSKIFGAGAKGATGSFRGQGAGAYRYNSPTSWKKLNP